LQVNLLFVCVVDSVLIRVVLFVLTRVSLPKGTSPEEHGVMSNSWVLGSQSNPVPPVTDLTGKTMMPSLFDVTNQAGIASAAYVAQGTNASRLVPSFVKDRQTSMKSSADVEAAVLRAVRAKTTGRQFTFAQLRDLSDVAVASGAQSTAYRSAVTKAAGRVAGIVRAYIDAGNERDTLLVVTSDHGFIHKFNGPGCMRSECADVPVVMRGPHVHDGDLTAKYPRVRTMDIAPTVAYSLAVPPHPAWSGYVFGVAASAFVKELPPPPTAAEVSDSESSPAVSPVGVIFIVLGVLAALALAAAAARWRNRIGSAVFGGHRYGQIQRDGLVTNAAGGDSSDSGAEYDLNISTDESEGE
jgi:Type I phosphodiesterase / nucleotide pyrophosphatase